MFNESQIESIFKVYDVMVEAEININGGVSFAEVQQKVADMFGCEVEDIFF